MKQISRGKKHKDCVTGLKYFQVLADNLCPQFLFCLMVTPHSDKSALKSHCPEELGAREQISNILNF